MNVPHIRATIVALKSASHPTVSPDGRRLAYLVTETDAATLDGRTTLWTSALDGTERRSLDPGLVDLGSPTWNAAGTHLFVTGRRADERAASIWLLDCDGTIVRSIPSSGTNPHSLSPSPSGRRLAYVARDEPPASSGKCSAVRVVTRLDYKEDGHGFLNECHEHVRLADLESGEQTTLTRGRFDFGTLSWSPDGAMLGAIRRTRVGLTSQLVLIDIASGAETTIGDPRWAVRAWGWSPDGASVVFFNSAHPEIEGDFYRLDLATDTQRRLTTDLPWTIDYPYHRLVWIDDHRIAILGYESGRSGIWSLDPTTGALERLFHADTAHAGLVGVQGSKTVVLSARAADQTGELLAVDVTTGRETALTHLNDAWFAENPPARIEERQVQHEGWSVPYLIKMPHDFDPTRRYPVIFEIHGGPHGFRGFDVEWSNQFLIDAGYLVVCPNPRGSLSYGLDYARGVLGDWGGGDWRDILATVDDVCALPYVDPDRLGIYGYSYGGYMTSWAIGHTDRFRAAVIGAPLTNLVSRVGTSDIGFAASWLEYEGGLPEIRDRLLAQSPVSHMHRAVTPTLLLHPEEDARCPIEQSEQLFEGLMRAGVETAFVRYPGQSHAMPWTGPAFYRIDYYTRVLDWFRSRV